MWGWTKFLGLAPPENVSSHRNPRGTFKRTSFSSYSLHRKVNVDLDFAVDELARRHYRRVILQWISQVKLSLVPLGQSQSKSYGHGCHTILISNICPYFCGLFPTKQFCPIFVLCFFFVLYIGQRLQMRHRDALVQCLRWQGLRLLGI